MSGTVSNFISVEELNKQLKDNRKWTIIDVRFDLEKPEWGLQTYTAGHIPGAVYMPLEYDFSSPVEKHGGRHPLPDAGTFTKNLNDKGIDLTRPIVIYDTDYPAYAGRLWWMFRFLYGKDDVYVLNGGIKAWNDRQLQLNTGSEDVSSHMESIVENRQATVCDSAELMKKITVKEHFALIDARAPERFLGTDEPIDAIAGHIPTAINFFWQSAYDADGKIMEVDELLHCLSNLAHYDNVIAYCGSGVTACAMILAMDESGIKNIRLYAGSWSDWITYDEYPKVIPEI